MKAEWFKKWDDDGEYDRDYWSRTSDRDSDDDEASSSGGWWDKFHGKGKKSSSYTPVKSTSAYLRSSYSAWSNVGSSRKDDMLEVLKEINKTINLTVNSEGGKNESSLTVRYSNGYCVNDLCSNTLYVSPQVMLDAHGSVLDKSADDYYSGLDALNGQAMLCSFMRKNVGRAARNQYMSSNNWAVRNLYMTDLQTTAGNEIRSEWPGFQSYIEQQQRTFAVSKESVIENLIKDSSSIDNYINLLCYNRLSTDRIDYHSLFEPDFANRMDAADKVLNESLDTPIDNDERFNRATDLFRSIQQVIDLQNPPPPPSNDNDDAEDQQGDPDENGSASGKADSEDDSDSEGKGSDGDGNSDQNSDADSDSDSDGGDGQSNPSQGKIDVKSINTNSTKDITDRFTGDNSYNNAQQIEGTEEANEVDPNAELQDRQKVERDNLKEINDVQLNDVTYRKVTPPVNVSTKSAYKEYVRSHRTAINNVKNCFQFHNTDYSLSTYGLASGSVDEGSFHKVFLGESERLYERRDVQARKKWLVTVLIDQSGSMDRSVRTPTGYDYMMNQARGLSIIFAEALKSLKDVDFSMYGFSTSGSTIDTYCYQDKETKKLEALVEAEYHNGTGIGFHVAHVGDKMLRQYPDYENKILFVITDGEPNMTPTPTMNGYQHTHHCCELLRKRGIHVFGIGIANAFGPDVGEMLFGKNNFTIINDVQSTLNVLTNGLRNFFKKMKK